MSNTSEQSKQNKETSILKRCWNKVVQNYSKLKEWLDNTICYQNLKACCSQVKEWSCSIVGVIFLTLVIAYGIVICFGESCCPNIKNSKANCQPTISNVQSDEKDDKNVQSDEKYGEDDGDDSGIVQYFCKIVSYTTQISITLMIVIFIFLIFDNKKNQDNPVASEDQDNRSEESSKNTKGETTEEKLIHILISALSISAIPTGISLLISSFEPKLISYMSGVEIYIAFAGFSIISVGYLGYQRDKKPTPPISSTKDTEKLFENSRD